MTEAPYADKVKLTSDWHLGHDRLRTTYQPERGKLWATSEEMDAGLIANHNSVVNDDDLVFNLGDVSWRDKIRTQKLLSDLKGIQHLILGNHDRMGSMDGVSSHILHSKDRWAWIKDYHEMKVKCRKTNKIWHFNLFHFPLKSFHWMGRKAIMVHGHVHSDKLQGDPTVRRFDVGVDANDFFPVSAQAIIDLAEQTEFEPKEDEY